MKNVELFGTKLARLCSIEFVNILSTGDVFTTPTLGFSSVLDFGILDTLAAQAISFW